MRRKETESRRVPWVTRRRFVESIAAGAAAAACEWSGRPLLGGAAPHNSVVMSGDGYVLDSGDHNL
jgi:hypothetical protein